MIVIRNDRNNTELLPICTESLLFPVYLASGFNDKRSDTLKTKITNEWMVVERSSITDNFLNLLTGSLQLLFNDPVSSTSSLKTLSVMIAQTIFKHTIPPDSSYTGILFNITLQLLTY